MTRQNHPPSTACSALFYRIDSSLSSCPNQIRFCRSLLHQGSLRDRQGMPGLLLSNPQQIIPDPPTSQKLLLGFPWYGDKFLTGHGIPQKCSQKCSEHLLCLEIVSKDLKVIGLALPASAAAMPTMKRLCCVCEQTVGFNRPQLTESETSGLHSSGGGMIATFKVMFTYAFGLCFSNMYVHAGEPEVHYLRHPLSPEDPAHGWQE